MVSVVLAPIQILHIGLQGCPVTAELPKFGAQRLALSVLCPLHPGIRDLDAEVLSQRQDRANIHASDSNNHVSPMTKLVSL